MTVKSILIAILIFLSIFTGGCGNQSKEITVGFIPTNDPAKMEESLQAMKDYLEKEIGVKIKIFIKKDYLSLVDDMKKKQVDIGWFGAFSYVTAEKELELEPLVLRYKKEMGKSYQSLIITQADSRINTIEELKGKSFAFVDPASTSGFIMPYALFKSRNIEFESYFSKSIYSGTHDYVARDVLARKVDAGAISSSTLTNLLKANTISSDIIKIIWKSEEIPGPPFVARADLNKGLKDGFKKAMLEIHAKDPQAMAVYDQSVEKFVEFDAGLYNGVRNIAKILNKDNIFKDLLNKE